MSRLRILVGLACLLPIAWAPTTAQGQQACPAPPALASSAAPNIFTPQQEVDLGDIEAEQVERSVRIIHDDELTAYMNRIVARILAQMPPTQLRFRVALIDAPAVDAFSLPGGRIYVTRKIVAFVHNDEELAGLLTHEMGHILSRQSGIETTQLFHDVLGVTSVADRKDIFEKFNRLLDNAARNPGVFRRVGQKEEPEQYQADRVAVYAMAGAGYPPQAFFDFFDRLAQTKGKTGGWMSDIFGLTTTDEKRLREIRESINELPGACRGQVSAPSSQEFLKWQADVIAYSGLDRREVLTGLLDKKSLNPPLRNDVTHLNFSPDGKYVLAQDDASIFVLSRDPLRLLFRIDATDAHPAQFTPDSQSVVFDTRGMRVEQWSIAEENRTNVREVAILAGCVQTRLSPDGKTLACLSPNFDLSLYDVAQGNQVFTKKEFFVPDAWTFLEWLFRSSASIQESGDIEWVRMAFSPDSRTFLVAGSRVALAVDIPTRSPVSLHGSLSEMLNQGHFTFLSPDRVIVGNEWEPKNAGIVTFPSGQVIRKLVLRGGVSAVTRGNYVIVGPLKNYAVAALDLSSQKFSIGILDSNALDIYDNTAVIQRSSGEIALIELPSLKLQAQSSLPQSPLGRLRAGTASPDLRWVAFSGDTRGAVWSLATAKRLYYTRSFHGAFFDGDIALFADFPKLEPQERSIGRMDLDGSGIKTGIPIDDKSAVRQWGQYLVSPHPAGKGESLARNVIYDVRDVRDGHLLWSRTFPKERPSTTLEPRAGTLLISWRADEDAAKDEIKNAPALKSRLAAIHDNEHAYLLEDLDARTGKRIGMLVVDTGKGSFRIEDAYAVGDWIVIVDSDKRTLLYSLSTGERRGSFFGTRSMLSPAAGLLSIENETGQLDLYALPTLEKRTPLIFSSPISLEAFSEDGKRLFVLTANQTAYTFDAAALARPQATTASSGITGK